MRAGVPGLVPIHAAFDFTAARQVPSSAPAAWADDDAKTRTVTSSPKTIGMIFILFAPTLQCTKCFDQASRAFRFRRRANRPNAPRPPVNKRRAAGSGVLENSDDSSNKIGPRTSLVMVMHPSVPAKTLPEFIAYAKAAGFQKWTKAGAIGLSHNC